MAGIDKLRTSNYRYYNEYRLWCIKHKPSLLDSFYEPFISYGEWMEVQKIQWEHFKDAPSYFKTELAVASFNTKEDRYLYWHCPLEFVREYLETQCGYKKANWFVKLFWRKLYAFNNLIVENIGDNLEDGSYILKLKQ